MASSANGRRLPAIELIKEVAAKKLETRKQQATQALHAEFDQLNALLAEKEKELLDMHVPCSVKHEFNSYCIYEDGQYRACFYVGLAKHKGVMRLCYGEDEVDLACPSNDDSIEWRPVVECSLDVRLEVAQHIATLRGKVIEAAEASIPKVQAAIAALRG